MEKMKTLIREDEFTSECTNSSDLIAPEDLTLGESQSIPHLIEVPACTFTDLGSSIPGLSTQSPYDVNVTVEVLSIENANSPEGNTDNHNSTLPSILNNVDLSNTITSLPSEVASSNNCKGKVLTQLNNITSPEYTFSNSTLTSQNVQIASNHIEKRKLPSEQCNEQSSSTSTIQSKSEVNKNTHSQSEESLVFEATQFKRRKNVNIFTEDTGPKWHHVNGNIVTEPFLPKNIPEAFQHLPVFGTPKSKEGLEDFYNEKIRQFVGGDLSDDKFNKLAQYCSPDYLLSGKELIFPMKVPCPGKLPDEFDAMPTPSDLDESNEVEANDLCMVKKFKMRMERDMRNQYMVRMKYRGVRLMTLHLEDDIGRAQEPLLEPGKDTLIKLRVYRPFSNNQKDKQQRTRHSVMSRDVVIPGRMTLADLRDRIACSNDLDLRVDISERPNDPPTTCAKDLFPSGFMFVNNVFYVDMRGACRDTSAEIRAWAAAKGLGAFPTRDMAAVSLQDMTLKLGHPEVYVHQGNCEHLFTLVEVRLVNPRDALKVSSYPSHTALSQNHTIYCTTCAEFGAKWIVTGSTRVPFDPAFFCDTCFRLYLYKGGEKIGTFKAYSYMGNELNMIKTS